MKHLKITKKWKIRGSYVSQIAIGFYWSFTKDIATFQLILPFCQVGLNHEVDIEDLGEITIEKAAEYSKGPGKS